MTTQQNLYMLLLGCKPPGRHTEQHDIYFGIGNDLKSLVPGIIAFWPQAAPKIHIDAWREVTVVGNYRISIATRVAAAVQQNQPRVFFINLGGYKPNEFDEFHYRMLVVAHTREAAVKQAKETAFFKHSQSAHVDDKYGIDVDDIYEIEDILPPAMNKAYSVIVTPLAAPAPEDKMSMGYFKLNEL
ncbi:DUF1543 domain-containing protein [Deminuibacter soli]|uniref:DUF1543 domain-containing protein n=1 Tax=Deminuibacter soli TaxID=2291815 RepID=A0A3E1ND88_9BACT|nr:DUF1543 domain-containing protein [Deminuibacter soli]RFM25804.1 DUF1543 domain-containing protein [Deminuibacter soli]